MQFRQVVKVNGHGRLLGAEGLQPEIFGADRAMAGEIDNDVIVVRFSLVTRFDGLNDCASCGLLLWQYRMVGVDS